MFKVEGLVQRKSCQTDTSASIPSCVSLLPDVFSHAKPQTQEFQIKCTARMENQFNGYCLLAAADVPRDLSEMQLYLERACYILHHPLRVTPSITRRWKTSGEHLNNFWLKVKCTGLPGNSTASFTFGITDFDKRSRRRSASHRHAYIQCKLQCLGYAREIAEKACILWLANAKREVLHEFRTEAYGHKLCANAPSREIPRLACMIRLDLFS